MKKILLALFLSLIVFSVPVFAADDFTDLTSLDFGFEFVDYLRDEGVVSGYDDGSFRPDDKINRAEFLKIAIGAAKANGLLDGEIGGSNCYKDVKDEWFAPYICKAAKLKYVDGYADGRFRPEQNINFAEASKIIANILKLPVDTSLYADSWFHPYIIPLQNRNAIPFSVLSFNQEISRIEMAEIISSAIRNASQDVAYSPKYVSYLDLKILTDWLDAKRLITHKGERADFYSHDGKVYALEFGVIYPVSDADPLTFQYLEGDYYIDKDAFFMVQANENGVDRFTDFSGDFEYWMNYNVNIYDGASFGFISDDENVYFAYYSDLTKIEGVDVSSFSVVPCGHDTCGLDKNKLYYWLSGEIKTLDVDGSTFGSYSIVENSEYWGDKVYAPFGVDDKNLYSFIEYPQRTVPSIIDGMDPLAAQLYSGAAFYVEGFWDLNVSSYILLDKEKVMVFLIGKDEWVEIEGIDPVTFEIVTDENKQIIFKDAKQSFKLNQQNDKFELVK